MDQDLLIKTISALRDQSDKDNDRAKQLSVIYGSDINPNDNRFLTDVIFDILSFKYPNSKEAIEFFCFEQDYGRASDKSVSELWEEIVNNLDVTLPFGHP